MATSLTGLTPSTTYDALIKVGDNGPIDGTLKVLSDGLGNDLPIQASTTAVNFTGALTQSGNTLQPTLVSGTSIKTVNSTSLLGSGDIAVQPTLVSGTNIKTLNSVSLLGSGDISISTSPSGVSGAIQFSNGSAFASDAANLFWDDTNNRLGVGTNAPTATEHIVGSSNTATDYALKILNLRGQGILSVANDGVTQFGDFSGQGYSATFAFIRPSGSTRATTFSQGNQNLSIQNVNGSILFQNTPIQVIGSGSTSATTSLLVQNSSAFTSLKTLDNGEVLMYPSSTYPTDTSFRSYVIGGLAVVGLISDRLTVTGGGANDTYIQGYGTYLHYERFRGLVINNSSSASLSTTPSALVEIQSTTQGFLPPKMTTTQKNAIASPAAGLVVYDSTMNATCEYNGTAWRVVSAGAQSVAASTATTTVDMSAGNVQNITLTASTTLTLSSAAVGTYILKLIQGGSGSYTVTWPGTVIWSGGTAPTLTTTVGKVDIVTLVFDGTNYYGNYSLNY